MIKKIKKWVNTKASVLTIALSNVEKNALTQTNEMLGSDINQTQRHTQGQLADALINGEITQEVKNLRWRTYKVLKESEGLTTEFIGYDADGMPITKTKKKTRDAELLETPSPSPFALCTWPRPCAPIPCLA